MSRVLLLFNILCTLPLISTAMNEIVPDLIVIPAGPFLFGTNNETRKTMIIPNDEASQSTISCSTFAIGRYEITTDEFQQFILDSGYERNRYWSPEGLKTRSRIDIRRDSLLQKIHFMKKGKEGTYPASGVSWYEAEAYCNWLSEQTGFHFRLPTEIEWEKAARGTDGRLWPWGDEWNPKRCNCLDRSDAGVEPDGSQDGFADIAPIGSFPSGQSPYGCEDMAGNVEEWCLDWVDTTNPLIKVLKGGSFYTVRPRNLRCARQGGMHPELGFVFRSFYGFRIASKDEKLIQYLQNR